LIDVTASAREMAGVELDRGSVAELEWRVRHRLFDRP
jgi:hypothetical protein